MKEEWNVHDVLIKQVFPSGIVIYYEYNEKGERIRFQLNDEFGMIVTCELKKELEVYQH